MTLMDFWRLLRKYWLIVLACAVVCGAAGFALAVHKSGSASISATANIVGNSQSSGVMGFASAAGRQTTTSDGSFIDGEESEYSLEVALEVGTQTVTVTVSGPEESECIKLANEVAEAACREATERYSNWENPYKGTVEKANLADVRIKSPSKKIILAAIMAGLFLGVCIVVLLDLKRRSVKSIEGMQAAAGLPVLEKLPAANGERLLANVRFASKKDDLERVCVVPLGDRSLALEVCKLLEDAIGTEAAASGRDAFAATAYEPLSGSMNGAYESRGADAVLVVGRQWKDSMTALEATVAELQLAGANVIGLVFAKK